MSKYSKWILKFINNYRKFLKTFGEDIPVPEQGWDFASFAEKMAKHQADFAEKERNDEFMHQSQSTQPHLQMTDDVERWLNQMYRRTAKVLHPDLQTDEQLKLEYQDKMAQLFHAKDVGDITTIFDLYLQYVGDEQFKNMSEQEEQ